MADAPCQTTQVTDPRLLSGLQSVALPTSGSWSSYDGTQVHVSLRSGDGWWEGAGAFEYTPPDGSPCDCGRLVAPITMTPAPG